MELEEIIPEVRNIARALSPKYPHISSCELYASTLYAAYRVLDKLDASKNLFSYLYRAAAGQVFDDVYGRKRRPEYLPDDYDAPMPEVEPELDHSEAFERIIARLPDHYKQVLTLRYVYDYSIAEIAVAIGSEWQQAQNLHHLALKKLRTCTH